MGWVDVPVVTHTSGSRSRPGVVTDRRPRYSSRPLGTQTMIFIDTHNLSRKRRDPGHSGTGLSDPTRLRTSVD